MDKRTNIINVGLVVFLVLGGIFVAMKLSYFNDGLIYQAVQDSDYVEAVIAEVINDSQSVLNYYDLDDSIINEALDTPEYRDEIAGYLVYYLDGINTNLNNYFYKENLHNILSEQFQNVENSEVLVNNMLASLLASYDDPLTNSTVVNYLQDMHALSGAISIVVLWLIFMAVVFALYIIGSYRLNGFLQVGKTFMVGAVLLFFMAFIPIPRILYINDTFTVLLQALHVYYQSIIFVLALVCVFAFLFAYGIMYTKKSYLKIREKELRM